MNATPHPMNLNQRFLLWRNRAVWTDPMRRVRTLESFSETEADGGRDLVVAARKVSDPELREHLERHAEDEERHAALFRNRAAELRSAAGVSTAGEGPDRPYDLSRGRPGSEVDAHGFFSAGLIEELGEVDYVAMLHVAECRAAEIFEVHRALNDHDPETTAIFTEILKDEKYHMSYTRRILDRWASEGRANEVKKGLKAARGSRFIGAWKRLGIRSAAGFGKVLLFVFLWTILLPFALLAKLGKGTPRLARTGQARDRRRRRQPVLSTHANTKQDTECESSALSAFHHDAAAALIVDGQPVAAAQEERFTRKRFDPAFPKRAARWCLQEAGLRAQDLDHVVFYEKPLRKFERLLATQLRAFPRSTRVFSKSMFLWLGDRLWMKQRIADELEIPASKVLFTEHHEAYSAAAFLSSPFDEAGILVVDGVGEWATTSLLAGAGTTITPLREIHFPHSLGLFVSTITQFLGFEPGADEAKVTALAAFGEPRMRAEIESLLPVDDDGVFHVDTERVRFAFDGERLFDERLSKLLGAPRKPTDPLRLDGADTRDADLAASLQAVVEDRVLRLARKLHEETGGANLCFAGELARDRRLATRLLEEGPFRSLYVAPSPDDAGGALGAALVVHHAKCPGSTRLAPGVWQLGEGIHTTGEEGARALGGADAVADELVRRLAAGEAVGWVRGRLEYGLESLGARSLLADATNAAACDRATREVRQDESFLPPRLAVAAERAGELFELPEGAAWPLVFGQVSVAAKNGAAEALGGALHVDGRAWIHLVERERDPVFHRVLEATGARTGVPVLLHATLHRRGAPPPRNEHDAVELLKRSSLDALVVEDRVYDPESVAGESKKKKTG